MHPPPLPALCGHAQLSMKEAAAAAAIRGILYCVTLQGYFGCLRFSVVAHGLSLLHTVFDVFLVLKNMIWLKRGSQVTCGLCGNIWV